MGGYLGLDGRCVCVLVVLVFCLLCFYIVLFVCGIVGFFDSVEVFFFRV